MRDYKDLIDVMDMMADPEEVVEDILPASGGKRDPVMEELVEEVKEYSEALEEVEDEVEEEDEREVPEYEEREPMSEEDILSAVKKDRDAAAQAQSLVADKLRSAYNAYHAIIDGRYNRPGRSTVVSSDVMDIVEWMMPSLMRVFTASQDIVVIQPVGGEDVKSAEQHQALINYQFNYKMEGFTKFYTWFKDALIYGLGVVKLTWETFYDKRPAFYEELSEEEFTALAAQPAITVEEYEEYEEVTVEETEDEGGSITEVAVTRTYFRNVRVTLKKVTYAGPWLENIPVSSFYIEPGARSVREANFVGHRVRRTMDYLRRMQREGVYHNVDEVIPHAEGDDGYSSFGGLSEIEGMNRGDVEETRTVASEGREFKWVWECWVKLDVDGDGVLEPLLVTFTDSVLLRVEENPFDHGEPPFETIVPIVDCHRLFGISITDLVLEFQRMKTSLYRNIFDNIAFSVNNVFLVNRSSGTDVGALTNIRPGAVVFTDDVNTGVRELKPETLAPGLFQLFEHLDSSKENRSGITRYSQGLDGQSLNSTATGISAIMTASQQRIELIARLFSETGIKYLFRKMISLNQQFLTDKIVLRLFNEPMEITPDRLDGSFDLMVNVGIGAGLKELQQSQMLNLLNILPNMAELGLVKPKHVYYVVTKLLESMGYKDIDSFMDKPQDQPMGQMGTIQAEPMQAAQGPASPIDAPTMFQ